MEMRAEVPLPRLLFGAAEEWLAGWVGLCWREGLLSRREVLRWLRHAVSMSSSQHEVPRRLRHAAEVGGRQRGHAAILRLLELHGWIEFRAKVLHRLRSMLTTAAPSGVVLLLDCVVVEFLSRPTQVVPRPPGENLAPSERAAVTDTSFTLLEASPWRSWPSRCDRFVAAV